MAESISEVIEVIDVALSCWRSDRLAESSLGKLLPGFCSDLSAENDLRLMLFIRRFEESLLRLFQEGKVNGTTHTCIGQEYVPVALMPLLMDDDYVFSNHRGHGHYLARFLDPEGLLCEILGRVGAVCNGVGGSQHIRRDRYYSTGVQGESVPVGVGVALGLKRAGSEGLAMTFIGDGTWGEGSVYEALNMASLWSVPLVVVCENNQIAQTTPLETNLAGSIARRAEAFSIDYVRVAEHDLELIRDRIEPALRHVRAEKRPLVIEFETQRLASHSKGDDTRSERELERIRENDWLNRLTSVPVARRQEIDAEVSQSVTDMVNDVIKRPPSEWDAFKGGK